MARRYPLEYLSVDVLVPTRSNPQSMDDPTFTRLVKEIGREGVGFISPITVVDLQNGRYRIIGGEHRWRAAKEAQLDAVPALILPLDEWDEDLQEFEVVRLNVLAGKLNAEKMIELYNRMAEKYGKEPLQEMFAFTDQRAFKRIIGEIGSQVKKSLTPEQSKKFEQKAKNAKSMDDLAVILQELFNEYGDTLDKSFMVFVYGAKKHIYVRLNQKGRRAMDVVLRYCAFANKDINDFLAPVLKEAGKRAELELQQAARGDDLDEDDAPF